MVGEAALRSSAQAMDTVGVVLVWRSTSRQYDHMSRGWRGIIGVVVDDNINTTMQSDSLPAQNDDLILYIPLEKKRTFRIQHLNVIYHDQAKRFLRCCFDTIILAK